MSFTMGSSIPILRILDESAAEAFYLDFLGFEVVWRHRFSEDSPLYMQIRQGESVLHLDGHATEETPPSMIRIPVVGLDAFAEQLSAKSQEDFTPINPRGDESSRDLNVVDPFDNHIVFWEFEAG